MTDKEKARAYDEALERTKQIIMDYDYDEHDNVFMEIFPELRESKDEMVKNCISMILTDANETRFNDFHTTLADCLDWLEKNSNVDNANKEYWRGYREGKQEILDKYAELEKQGKKESNDKNEPKFHEGDWVVSGQFVTQIREIAGDGYVNSHNGFIPFESAKYYHLWTIADAKDGDVLFHSDSASNGIFIFKKIIDRGFAKKIICYCDYDSEDHFCLGEHHTCCWADAKILHPATKEQLDLLFAKMKEAGYEWLEKTKELKKIEQKSAEWSEEDETNSYHLKTLLENLAKDIKHEFRVISYNDRDKYTAWLKSLKDRVQPKQKHDDWNHTLIKN